MPKEIFYKIVRVGGEDKAGRVHSQVRKVLGEDRGTQVYSFPFIDGQWHVTVIGAFPDCYAAGQIETALKNGLLPTASKEDLRKLKERQIFALPQQPKA